MSIFPVSSKAHSIFNFKCPRCHIGDLYATPTFSMKRSFFMYSRCPHCGQPYELESGFWYGAMFMSYIAAATVIFGGFSLFYFVLGIGAVWSFGLATILTLTLYVWIFRISRSSWINFFVAYDPKYKEKSPSS